MNMATTRHAYLRCAQRGVRPGDLDLAVPKMRVGGSRVVQASALVYQVELSATGK